MASVVKMNHAQFTQIQTNVQLASESMESILEDIWGTNFDNLYNDFVDSGFLNDLYEDAESNFYELLAGSAAFASVSSAILAALGIVALGPVGWVLTIIGIIFGIRNTIRIASGQKICWVETSKDVLIDMLNNCRLGYDDCYIQGANILTDIYNIQVGLEAVKSKINDYQLEFANLSEAAKQAGLEGQLQIAGDGFTITDITTTIKVGDQDVPVTISEGMNAFFTWMNVTQSAAVEAAYLAEKYPDDYNITDLLKNIVDGANAMTVKNIESGLYSKEMVDTILPEYNPNLDNAKDKTAETAGLSLEGLESLLGAAKDKLGDIGLYAGLLGANLIGGTDHTWPTDMAAGDGDKDKDKDPDTSDTPDDTGDNSNPSGPGTSCGGCGGCGGGTTPSPSPDPTTTPTPTPTEEEGPHNELELEEVDKTELPEEELKVDYGMGDDVDYDKLAREAYEFGEGAEEIAKHQQELLDEIEAAFESGNLEGLRKKLEDYGFSGPEIDSILNDKYLAIKTLMYCDKRDILAAKAKELAAADGVTDYDTSYDEKIDYDKELNGEGANDLLMLASEDEACCKAYETMNTAKEAYDKALAEANPSIVTANEKKKAMQEIKEKYEKEFSSEDTKKWTEEAAKEYNEAIKAYNESVKTAATQMAAVEAAKTTYLDARTTFENAEKAYYEQVKNETIESDQGMAPSEDDGSGADTGSGDGDNGGNQGGGNSGGNGGSNSELHTDNVVIDPNGDITFDMNGQVQGASYEPGTVGSGNTDPADQDILNGLNISDTGISS